MNQVSITKQKTQKVVDLTIDSFGFLNKIHGEHLQVKRFTWKNSNRIQVQLITFGATVTSIRYPNKKGIIEDIILGFEDLQSYIDNSAYNFGSSVGRVANFVREGSFTLNKKDINLTNNSGKHHFNGGLKGFDTVNWNYHVSGNKVILSHMSPDNDEGYPGDLLVFASFELTNTNEFKIEYKATVTKPTIINIANHCFFNLAGHGTGVEEIRKHTLMVNADCHTLIGEDALPTGEIQSVLNTVYDFQTPVKIASILDKLDGFNSNLCINRGVEQQGVNFVARLFHPPSGRILEVYSNQYGVQIDTANMLPAKVDANTESSTNVIKPQRSGNPYLRSSIATFDMLDEIYNKLVEVRTVEDREDYDELLLTVQNLQKKASSAFRSTSINDGNTMVKRSVLTLENLPVYQLAPLQIKYVEKILSSIEKIEMSAGLGAIKTILDITIENNKCNMSQASFEKRKNSQASTCINKIVKGKKGAKYSRHDAISIQCQNYPDAIHNPNFPSPILKPGQVYTHIVTYKFWIKTDQVGISGII